jgi:membrane fusion protein, adhesin transport system
MTKIYISLIFSVFSLCIIGSWSYYGTLDIVTTVPGVVVPLSKIKRVQHLEGGIISSINITEGDEVKKGASLMELEGITSHANLNELKVRIAQLNIDLIRLNSEIDEEKEQFYPKKYYLKFSESVKRSFDILRIRKKNISNMIEMQKQIYREKHQEMWQIEERINTNKKFLTVINERIKISEDLMKDDLSNRFNHLNYLERKVALEGEVKSDFLALEISKNLIIQSKMRIGNIKDKYYSDVISEINQKQSKLEELSYRIKKFEDNNARKIIRSPSDGKIKYLYFSTIGGVVSPGDVILEIVPNEDRLIIEGQLPSSEVAYLRLGQEVKIRLAAAGPAGMGYIDGKVNYISADTIAQPGQNPYYLIKIEISKNKIKYNNEEYKLFPGEAVNCSILTGERRVIDYFIDSFFQLKNNALLER